MLRDKIVGTVMMHTRQKGDVWYMRLRGGPDKLDTERRIGPAWKAAGRPATGYFTVHTAQAYMDEYIETISRAVRGNDPFFDIAADEFVIACERKRRTQATMRTYRSIIERELKPAFGAMRLSQISPQDMMKLRETIATRPRYAGTEKEDTTKKLSSSTINQTLAILNGIYKLAIRTHEYTGPCNTAYFDRAPVAPPGDIDVYTPDEVLRIADAALTLLDKTAFLVLGLTGIRLNELRALHWRDVDIEGSSLFVRGGYTDDAGFGPTKTKKIRTVPLAGHVATALTKLTERGYHTGPNHLVFCTTRGGVIGGDQLYKRLHAAARAAGVRELRLHDMRHTFGTMAVKAWPLHDVQAYLGHSQLSTTMRYLHHKPHTDAAETIDAMIASGK